MCIFRQNDLQPYLPTRILLGAVKYSQHLIATPGDSGQGLGPSSEGVSEAQAVMSYCKNSVRNTGTGKR